MESSFEVEADAEALAVVEVEWVGVVAAAGVGRKESVAGLELKTDFEIARVPIHTPAKRKAQAVGV